LAFFEIPLAGIAGMSNYYICLNKLFLPVLQVFFKNLLINRIIGNKINGFKK
jgi:hypothetical protein